MTVGAADAGTDVSLAARNGVWIAYSTAPITGGLRGGFPGSDVYVVREGHAPILVASREDTGTPTKSWHNCPAFSPDGTKLAYGTRSHRKLTISVMPFTNAGPTVARRVTLKGGTGTRAPCPQWSPDGSRLANVNARVVSEYGFDGSGSPVGASDPRVRQFENRHSASLVSPTGDLVALQGQCGPVIERPDGSHRHDLYPAPCGFSPYAIATWSPDGRRLLLMEDVGNGFTMIDASVSPPFARVPVVEDVQVNNDRSWPGRFDVSWQPRP